MLPQALESATRLETELREGVPLDISQHLGLVHSDSNTPRRKELIGKIKKLFDKVIDHLQFGKN